jgi:predicted N-formylglutamate amidohydrolase
LAAECLQVEKRLAEVWRPYHNALAALVRSSPAETTFLLSLHSYTHQFEQQPVRT